MKLTTKIAIAGLWLCATSGTYAQDAQDKTRIEEVTKLAASGKCTEASGKLKLITDGGKQTAAYTMARAKVWECSGPIDSAIAWYTKYLAINSADDSTWRKLTALKEENEKSASIQAKYSSHYKKTAGLDKKTRHRDKCVEKQGICYGTNYIGLLSANSPFKRGQAYEILGTKLIKEAKIVREFGISAAILYTMNKPWLSKSTGIPISEIGSAKSAWFGTVRYSLSYLFFNKEKTAFFAGPEIGFSYVVMPEIGETSFTSGNGELPSFTRPSFGIKATYLPSRWFAIKARFAYSGPVDYESAVVQKVNISHFEIGVAYFLSYKYE